MNQSNEQELPTEIQWILDRCWELDQEGRYADSGSIVMEWHVPTRVKSAK